MSKIFEHKGYLGSINHSVEDECLYGKLLFITDTVTYESDTIAGLKREFQDAVEDYIETCIEIGKEPDKPFKGSFNVRLTPELHRKAAVCAVKEGTTLNDLVAKSIEDYVDKPVQPLSIEHHEHVHHHYNEHAQEIGEFESSFGVNGGELKWIANPPTYH